MTKLLGISGALRKESTNTKLVREAARLFGPDDFVLADLRLPLYDGDLEAEGIPEPVERLAQQIRDADAVVISTPEYDKSVPGVLINALNWISRVKPRPTDGKPLAMLSASAGIAGGQRAKSVLYLTSLPFNWKFVWQPEVNLGQSHTKFDDDGRLTDEAAEKFLGTLMGELRAAI